MKSIIGTFWLIVFCFPSVHSSVIKGSSSGKHILISNQGNIQIPQTTSKHADYPIETEVFFTCDGVVREKIISFIKQEQKKISVVVFTFTDKKIAQCLIDAHKRGVVVEVIVDGKQAEEEFSKIDFLAKNDVPVWCYQSPGKRKGTFRSFMHHKFIIFYDTRRFLTGSLNLTRSACDYNCENIYSVLYDTRSLKKYKQECKRVKKECIRYEYKKGRSTEAKKQ